MPDDRGYMTKEDAYIAGAQNERDRIRAKVQEWRDEARKRMDNTDLPPNVRKSALHRHAAFGTVLDLIDGEES